MVLGILNDEFVISAFDFVMVNVPNVSIDFYNGDNLIAELMFDDDFVDTYCPELNEFFDDNATLLQSNIDALENLRI